MTAKRAIFVSCTLLLLFGMTSAWSSSPTSAPAAFAASTKIAVNDSTNSIEQLKVGDKIWSSDPKTRKTVLKEVAQISSADAETLVEVQLLGKDKIVVGLPFCTRVEG